LQRDYSVASIFVETRQAIRIVLPAHREAHQQLKRIRGLLARRLTPAVLNTLKTGICHGDPHHENLFIEPDTGKVTMFDFDFSGNGHLLYAQAMPLTGAERELVPCFTVLMRLFHLGARSKNADGIKNPLWAPDEIAAKIDDIEKEARGLTA
jgi:Ser/Thr protein kinase RdoA (MazF antagonist)